jgi:hypothetical protein
MLASAFIYIPEATTVISYHNSQEQKENKSGNATRKHHVPPPSASSALLKYSDKSRRTPHSSQDIRPVSFSCAQLEHCQGPELPRGSSGSDWLSVLGTN